MGADSLKILLVDDEPFIRDMIGEMLAAEGHDVATAEDGCEALTMTGSSPDIDLVISDMEMPRVDGMELIRRLRGKEILLPIIILTGNDEIKVAVEAMKAGADDYLLKDENIQDAIPMAIDRVMKKFRLAEKNRQLMADLARKNRELERLSLLDALTDIPNRRYFDRVLAKEWKRSLEAGAPLSLLMVDIDYFKRFNDAYGHPEGDVCLQRVAGALHRTLTNPGDFVARYGGEEFAAVLPATAATDAAAAADAMRANVRALDIPHADSDVDDRVTLSVGVGALVPDAATEPAELVALADGALYRAKREGRDRTVAAPAECGP